MAAAQGSLAGSIGDIGKITELRKRFVFLVLALIVYRIGTFVPVPGINPQLSVFALGIMPYISASIIVQLMTVVVPHLEQLKKEGEAGRRKITQYTRYGTVLLATFQGIGVAIALQAQQVAGGDTVAINPGMGFVDVAWRADH